MQKLIELKLKQAAAEHFECRTVEDCRDFTKVVVQAEIVLTKRKPVWSIDKGEIQKDLERSVVLHVKTVDEVFPEGVKR